MRFTSLFASFKLVIEEPSSPLVSKLPVELVSESSENGDGNLRANSGDSKAPWRRPLSSGGSFESVTQAELYKQQTHGADLHYALV
ncbi:hypothetical protein PG985_005896 [Apiospora marii]|uniref:uncharacterized protein n=1 Tax=Apiospora marii TaxID=335849 RepID=UPI00312F1DC5